MDSVCADTSLTQQPAEIEVMDQEAAPAIQDPAVDSTDNQAETVANPTEQPQPEKPQPEVKPSQPEQPQTYDDLFPSLPTAAPGTKLFLS